MTTVQFDQVSKKFLLHKQRSRSLQELFLGVFNRQGRPKQEPYWALRDVNFEVGAGEMVGFVGPNGAGKSTLLKLIARIIEPTSGAVQVNGSVGALLELGAGFHPDLTGKENIYLNGSILGFNKNDMNSIYDDIVDFSEMGRFIDVPVKHYSSGMYMRLGFSIAIHLQPDILLVDEVLAVGDRSFQLRCLDKINKMKRDGVAIILVTHDLTSVRDLCDRAIWLDEGRVRIDGPVDHALEEYIAQVQAQDEAQRIEDEGSAISTLSDGSDDSASRWGSQEARIAAVQLLDGEGTERRVFQTRDALTIRIHYEAQEPIQDPMFGLALHRNNGFHISGPNSVFSEYPIPEIQGQGFVDYQIGSLPLLPGSYLVSAAIYDHDGDHAYDHIHQGLTFRVIEGGVREEYGSFYIPATWKWTPESAAGAAVDRDDNDGG